MMVSVEQPALPNLWCLFSQMSRTILSCAVSMSPHRGEADTRPLVILKLCGGLNIFSKEFKFQSFLYPCLGHSGACRYETLSLAGKVCFIDISSRCWAAMSVSDIWHHLVAGHRLDICFPGGNGKMIRPELSSPGQLQDSVFHAFHSLACESSWRLLRQCVQALVS